MANETRQVAIITGAGSGIGRAVAQNLAGRGWRLALVGRREDPLVETAALLVEGAVCMTIAADVGIAEQALAMVDAVVGAFGRLDALVNNAGYAPMLPIERNTPEVMDEVFRTNALGPGYTIARSWPVFQRQRSGCVINVSTLGTLDPFPGFFAYAAAKSAVNSMVRSCAREGRAHGIRAFAVAPGNVETAMFRSNFPESKVPRSSCLSPQDVAALIMACIEGEHDARCGETLTIVP